MADKPRPGESSVRKSAASTTVTNRPPLRRHGRAQGQRPAPQRTLGPVNDLERHLPQDWWRNLFTALYLKTDGDVVENQANTAHEIDLLVGAVGLQPDDRVLDLCCGQGRHSLELARRGFRHVHGIDRSRYLVRLGRKRAKQEGLPVAFQEGDARKFRVPESSFDCVCLMGNSFGYFDSEEDDAAVLKSVVRALRSGGIIAMDLVDGAWMSEHFEKRSWEWIDQDHFVCRERSLDSGGRRLISREVVVHAERGVIADQFYAERLYTAESVTDLLNEVGFTEIRFHEMGETQSERNQDLGMMARRMFVTAKAPLKLAPAAAKRIPFPEVTVLLGDPRLPDPVKKGGKFNPEDLETVAKLKAALAALPGYSFTYLDNHASMLADLRARPPAFVLNLCDEGYNNDAFQELHVPAYLEVLGVPYTGAGPACLGLCYDKALVRAAAQAIDVPVPLETYFNPDDQSATIPSVFPALIKPNYGDSSIGITSEAVVHTPGEAVRYLTRLREMLPGRPILIQEYLTGTEYSVGIVGNPGQGYTVLPLLEVDYSGLDPALPPILSYESKWEPGSPYWTDIKYREGTASDELKRSMTDYSCLMFERLGCRDYARFDFRADAAGTPKLLEVNPNPGWCWDGKFNLMAAFDGLRYADLLRLILEAAQNRVVAAWQPAVAEPQRRVAGG